MLRVKRSTGAYSWRVSPAREQEVQGMQKQLTKIPSALRKLDLSSVVEVSEHITPEEGAIVLVVALADSGKQSAGIHKRTHWLPG